LRCLDEKSSLESHWAMGSVTSLKSNADYKIFPQGKLMKTLDPFKVKRCTAEAEEMANHSNKPLNNFIIVISEENIKILKSRHRVSEINYVLNLLLKNREIKHNDD
jgi:hypothetical protein